MSNKEVEQQPSTYSRRVLLSVVGTSPQVVSETLYGLMSDDTPFIPTEIILVTTSSGAAAAKKMLLDTTPPVLEQMTEDYHWPPIPFSASSIKIIQDPQGQPLDDIRSQDDSQYLADCITELIRDITADDNSALHVSIAGGRKTMSFFAGYILTLFGRTQDSLSHVLVDEALIGTDFFYPRPNSNIEVSLANIPFLPLRSGMNELILSGNKGFAATVTAMKTAKHNRPLLAIDAQHLCISANNEIVELSPPNMAFLIMLAKRVSDNLPGYSRQDDDDEDRECAKEYLSILTQLTNEWSDTRPQEAIERSGRMDSSARDQRKTQINKILTQHLGKSLAKPYLITTTGKTERGQKLFGLSLEPEQISFIEIK
ncbi:MAG: CRISPR-associated ring nuclease Csm6 [Motiliproteus sp.]